MTSPTDPPPTPGTDDAPAAFERLIRERMDHHHGLLAKLADGDRPADGDPPAADDPPADGDRAGNDPPATGGSTP